VLALLIGIISGTYSSIFNASPLLVVWHNWEAKRLGRTNASRAPRTRRAAS
jgi:preprotein translocase subunit SecF